jgi:hypothetical protein
MKRVLATIVLLLISAPGWAQDAAPEPLPQHKLLAKEVGEWEGVMKMYVSPDGPPIEMSVTESNKMLDGGLWVISEFEAGPFIGRGHFGYDPDKKKFVGSWLDNQTMSLGILEGSYDEKTGEITYLSNAKSPATGKNVPTKQVGKVIDENHRTFVAYIQNADGKSWDKWMEISYKRK